MNDTEQPGSVRDSAAKALWDRGIGRPVQAVLSIDANADNPDVLATVRSMFGLQNGSAAPVIDITPVELDSLALIWAGRWYAMKSIG